MRSLARTVANLPAQLSTIVGRDADVAAVRQLLADSRLVTVTGRWHRQDPARSRWKSSGRVRRQRRRVHSPRCVHRRGPDSGRDPAGPAARHRPAREPLDRLAEHFAARGTLLVLDNLEQLPGAGVVVRSLLDRARPCRSSRRARPRSTSAGEQEYALGTLPLAADRSAQGGPGASRQPAVWPCSSSGLARFGRISGSRLERRGGSRDLRPVDGLPLAIELAAAQVKMLSRRRFSIGSPIGSTRSRAVATTSRPAADPPGDRCMELRAARRGRAAALPPPVRLRGRCHSSEIEAIAAADPAIPMPSRCSRRWWIELVSARRGASGNDRFGLFETMRAYGRELLRERRRGGVRRSAGTRRSIGSLRSASGAGATTAGRAAPGWIASAEDHDNLRAALDELAGAGDLAAALDLAADLWRFWQQRGHHRGPRTAGGTPRSSPAPACRRSAHSCSAEPRRRAGGIRYWRAPTAVMPRPFYERSLAHAIASGDRRREAWARYNLRSSSTSRRQRTRASSTSNGAAALREDALAEFRDAGRASGRRGITLGHGRERVDRPHRA